MTVTSAFKIPPTFPTTSTSETNEISSLPPAATKSEARVEKAQSLTVIKSPLSTSQAIRPPAVDMRLSAYANTMVADDVWLRPIFPTDWPCLIPIYTDAESMKYFGRGKTLDAEAICDLVAASAARNLTNPPTQQRWAVITREGVMGLLYTFDPGEADKGRVEIAYCINKAVGGRGLTTKASQLVIATLEQPFVATVHPDNIPSRAVLLKLGFKKDPTRVGVAKFGQIRDYYILDMRAET